MEVNKKEEEQLNLLINLQEDRVRIYEHAQTEAKEDQTLLSILRGNIIFSEAQIKELSLQVTTIGGSPETGSSLGGELYKAWTELLETFAGQPIAVALSSCEKADERLLNAYTEILNDPNDPSLSPITQELLQHQRLALTQQLNELSDWLSTYSVPDDK